MVFYWWGDLDLGANDHLLDDFYLAAPDQLPGAGDVVYRDEHLRWDNNAPTEVL